MSRICPLRVPGPPARPGVAIPGHAARPRGPLGTDAVQNASDYRSGESHLVVEGFLSHRPGGRRLDCAGHAQATEREFLVSLILLGKSMPLDWQKLSTKTIRDPLKSN